MTTVVDTVGGSEAMGEGSGRADRGTKSSDSHSEAALVSSSSTSLSVEALTSRGEVITSVLAAESEVGGVTRGGRVRDSVGTATRSTVSARRALLRTEPLTVPTASTPSTTCRRCV